MTHYPTIAALIGTFLLSLLYVTPIPEIQNLKPQIIRPESIEETIRDMDYQEVEEGIGDYGDTVMTWGGNIKDKTIDVASISGEKIGEVYDSTKVLIINSYHKVLGLFNKEEIQSDIHETDSFDEIVKEEVESATKPINIENEQVEIPSTIPVTEQTEDNKGFDVYKYLEDAKEVLIPIYEKGVIIAMNAYEEIKEFSNDTYVEFIIIGHDMFDGVKDKSETLFHNSLEFLNMLYEEWDLLIINSADFIRNSDMYQSNEETIVSFLELTKIKTLSESLSNRHLSSLAFTVFFTTFIAFLYYLLKNCFCK
ncbi:hypothetical protein QTN25_008375 [Entamoeba marina]